MTRLILLAVFFAGLSFIACSNPAGSSGGSASVTVEAFPSDIPSYIAVLGYYKSTGDYISDTVLGTVSSNQSTYSISAPGGAAAFTVFLFNPNDPNGSPLYCEGYSLVANKHYTISYWVNYELYFSSPSTRRYGISLTEAETMSNLNALSLDFTSAPYYLFQYPNTLNSYILANYSSNGSKVLFGMDSSLSNIISAQEFIASQGALSGSASGTFQPLFLCVQPVDFTIATAVTVDFNNINRVSMPDNVVAIVPTGSADTMYCLTGTSHSLYQINPMTQTVTKIIQFNIQGLVNIVYSSSDKKIYAVSGNSATLVVYDIATNQEADYTYSSRSSEFGKEIAIDSTHRRIYVHSYYNYADCLIILNQDTYSQVASPIGMYGMLGYFALDPIGRFLYDEEGSLYKFDVSADSLNPYAPAATYTNISNGGGEPIELSPDGSMLAYASIDEGYLIRCLSTANLTTICTWNIGPYPVRAVFNSNATSIFGTIGDGYLYNAQIANLTQVKKYILPTGDNGVYIGNCDGSYLVGATSNASVYTLYFIDLSQPISSKALVGKGFSQNGAVQMIGRYEGRR